MKKIFVTLLTAIMGLGAMAQEVEPNRLLVTDKNGGTKGFILENVDYMSFANVEGEVAADVEILDVALDVVTVSVKRTEACQSFKLSCFPTVRIAKQQDAALVSAVDSDSPNQYYQDFEQAQMTGMSFEPASDYTIVTLGYDQYGVACDIRKAQFTTPEIPIVGSPEVAIEDVDIQKYQFTLKFTPNADVSKFSVVAGKKGELQSQYEMFAPMMGFVNFRQMIESWGVSFTEASEFSWKDMAPGTEYEVFVLPYDNDGNKCEPVCYNVSTLALGGEGTAEVAITLGQYKLTDWGGEMLPSQFITYTPNDQSNAYRFSVYLASEYDANSEEIKSQLCTEPPMPMVGWFFYEALTTDYQINPNTEAVAIAAAKNINGEWGPVTEVRFTTTAEAAGAAQAPSKEIKKRSFKSVNQKGMVPVLKSNTAKLIAK